MSFLSSDFFKINFLIISVSNSSDPDLDRHNVGPDLGPHCLHRSSAED